MKARGKPGSVEPKAYILHPGTAGIQPPKEIEDRRTKVVRKECALIDPNTLAKWLFVCAWMLGSLLLPSRPAMAIPIVITDPAPIPFEFVQPNPPAACEHLLRKFTRCKSSAYVFAQSLSWPDSEFQKSFDAWNEEIPGGRGWTLRAGGALPGTELTRFEVSTFRARAVTIKGGVDIQIDWTYQGADKGDFFWTQGLFDNYSGLAPMPARYEMDVLDPPLNPEPGDTWTGARQPLYPVQYPDRALIDKPRGPWPDSFFYARSFLATVDESTRTLRIYEGVGWGFQLSAVPEPSTLVLVLIGIGFIALTVRDRHGKSQRK